MVHALYRNNEDIYIVEILEDYSHIDEDATLATTDVQGVDLDEYKSRMRDSVDQRLAYHVKKNGARIGLAYSRMSEIGYEGCSIYCKGDLIATMVLLRTMFEICDYHKIQIYPHEGTIHNFISMVTADSIREYHQLNKPLVIVKKDILQQGEKLFKYLNIEKL